MQAHPTRAATRLRPGRQATRPPRPRVAVCPRAVAPVGAAGMLGAPARAVDLLDAVIVVSDVGIMGGSGAEEFMVLNDFGEDTLVLCDNCD